MRVIVWSDDRAGAALSGRAAELHPEGIGATLATLVREQLGSESSVVATGLHEPEDGLPERRLADADALVWWGHEAHQEVSEGTVERVRRHVLDGLGLVVLHSGHHAKVFRRLMGTSCDLSWREDGEDEELIWTVDPRHPVAEGVSHPITLGRHEMYGELFDIPAPDALVFISAFSGGEVFRSGCAFHRGSGRIFYFSVGHETHPVYEHPEVRRVVGNAVRWVRRGPSSADLRAGEAAPRWKRSSRRAP